MYMYYSMYCTLSGSGPLPMESSTPPPPSETTRDDVPGPSGEWSTCVNSSQSDCILIIWYILSYVCTYVCSYLMYVRT